MVQLFSNVFEWSFAGLSEEEMTERSTTLFLELSNELEKTYISTVPVYLVKKEGKWLMVGSDKNFELINALTGGVLEFAKKLAESSDVNG